MNDPVERPKKEFLQKPIRTYESDLAEAIRKQKSSTASMIIAEKEKKEKSKIHIPVIKPLGNISTAHTVKSIPKPVEPPKPIPKPPAPKPVPPHIDLLEAPLLELLLDVAHPPPPPPLPPPPPPKPEPRVEKIVEPIPEPIIIEEAKEPIANPIIVPIIETSSEPEPEPVRNPINIRKFALLLSSIVLIFAGGAGTYYLYKKIPVTKVPLQPKMILIPSIIPVDSQKIISVNSQTSQQLKELISNEFAGYSSEPGKIFEFILQQNTASAPKKMTASEFIKKTNLNMPDILERSLTDNWMIGGYEAEGQKLPFIIFTSSFFQNTFAGMLKWEAQMPGEFSSPFGYENKARYGTFKDRIVRNRDVREFKNELGETILLYSFIDKDTIVITTSEATLASIIERIEKQSYIR